MRRQDWPERALEVIEKHDTMPLEWGKSDCFTFPMDIVKAITGKDPYKAERAYTTEAGAGKRLKSKKFKNVGDAFAALYKEIPPALAQRGDIGTIEGEHGCSGVVFWDNVVWGKAPVELEGRHRLMRVPRDKVTRAFRVE